MISIPTLASNFLPEGISIELQSENGLLGMGPYPTADKVDPDMINLARTFNATRWQIFKMIEFRDAMPPLFSGLRIGPTLAIIGVAVGEMVGGSEGLGAVLVSGGGSGNTALVFVAIVIMTLVGILAYVGVVFIEKRVLHYMPRKELNAI